jgi:hypothetical protein
MNRYAAIVEKIAVSVKRQKGVVIETDGRGYMVNYPDGGIEGAMSHSDAERKAKRWFRENLKDAQAVGVGAIEWRKVDKI